MIDTFTHNTCQNCHRIFTFLFSRFSKTIAKFSLKTKALIRLIIRSSVLYNNLSFCAIFTFFLFLFQISPLQAQQFDSPIYFKKKLNTIKEVLVLPVNFDCYYLTSGGIREYNYDMTTRSRKLIIEKVSKILTSHSFSVTTLPENSWFEKCWHPLRHFYSVVNYQILKNVYGDSPFPDAVSTFSYVLPPIPDSLLYTSTDAVLFIDGFDDCATRKREHSKSTTAGIYASIPEDQTAASCALVDRKGTIIWYYRYRKEDSIDMTYSKDVEQFFTTLLHQLRKGGTEK